MDALCLSAIARFKRPRGYVFLETLPKNNYGKVLKTELRKRHGLPANQSETEPGRVRKMTTQSRRMFGTAALGVLAAIGTAAFALPAAAEEPLKIGFSMAQTGPLAGTGKSALLAMTIWAEDINAKGGLLGRQVKLVHYDDQSNPANVPAIYAKLIDLDKVDLINQRLRHADHRLDNPNRHAARHGADGLLRSRQ